MVFVLFCFLRCFVLKCSILLPLRPNCGPCSSRRWAAGAHHR